MIIKLAEQNVDLSNTPQERPERFALIGAAGFIAPRHFRAIHDTGNELAAAVDPHDSVGLLDNYFPNAKFFTEIERFDRYLESLRRDNPIKYITICSPNYLHDAHVRLALRVKADAICEKPLVINPWNLDQLLELEAEHGRRIHTILQLRLHPAIQRLQATLEREKNATRRDIVLTYVTRRGAWYHSSWKGTEEKSGGLAMNIGVHFFDVLTWLFGSVQRSQLHLANRQKMSGVLELESARVRWFLSVDHNDLPVSVRKAGQHAYRSLTIDGQEIDFSDGFTDLHTEQYRRILNGTGFGIEDARQSVELIYAIRNSREVVSGGFGHPILEHA
ncbi:MAG: UDP-N-acetyl-2-amino-2-deoxyglucuronate dehydrogenase [Pirellulaceae bacterium]|jgi:UDP-N-acetyl-2-amino-2-deoxyglucuronate dehydrogenase